ncbi:MAG TPA: nucleotide exchange factor GrpE [Gemmatimonadales bacterium]|nr:nucleotide exchange factor GrpE [Gemmatimonadales bacterium]
MVENKNVGNERMSEEEIGQDPGNAGEADAATDPVSGQHGAAAVPMELDAEAVRRLERESAELRDRHLRLAAEYDNFRKRAARERTEMSDRSQAALAVRLLEVLDDLDRVVAEGTQSTGDDVMRQALVLIDRKLRKELEAAGLERLEPDGQPFDPSLHEAVSVVVPPEPSRDHTVAATFQAGYRFKGSLIRPARVQVYSSEGHA